MRCSYALGLGLLIFGCGVEESSGLLTCPTGTQAQGGLCAPITDPGLIRVPFELDLPAAQVGFESAAELLLLNTGEVERTVVVNAPSDPAFYILEAGNPLILTPGENTRVQVTFRPNRAGRLQVSLTTLTCDGGCPQQTTLRGEGFLVMNSLICEPVQFGEVPVGQCAFDLMVCVNQGDGVITIVDAFAESDEGAFQLQPQGFPIRVRPGTVATLPLSFCPIFAGPSAASIRIETDEPGGGPYFGRALGAGRQQETACRLEYQPIQDFAPVAAMTPAIHPISFFNSGSAPCELRVTGLSVGSTPPFRLFEVPIQQLLEPGEQQIIEVGFDPSPVGRYRGELNFEVLSEAPAFGTIQLRAQVADLGAGLDVTSGPAGPLEPLQGGNAVQWIGGDDDGYARLPLPFPFTIFGQARTEVWVDTNGYIAFEAANQSDLNNTSLPSPSSPNEQISWWWDDLNPGQAPPPGVVTAVEGPVGQRVLRIQFLDVPQYSGGPQETVSAELRLHEQGSEVQIQYGEPIGGGSSPGPFSASVGWEGPLGARGLDVLGCSPSCDATNWPARTTYTYRDAP